jgi:hypothetical protein
MLQIFKASLETRNFSFEAYGYSEVEAHYIMRQVWAKHRRQLGATDTWADVEESVNVQEIIVNAGYRDGTLIHRQTKARGKKNENA